MRRWPDLPRTLTHNGSPGSCPGSLARRRRTLTPHLPGLSFSVSSAVPKDRCLQTAPLTTSCIFWPLPSVGRCQTLPGLPGATMILPCMVPLLSAPLRPSVAPHPLLSQSGMGSGDPTCPGVFSPEGSLTLMFSITVQGSWRSLSSHHSPLVEEAFLVDWPCPLSAHRSPRHSYVPLALTLIDHRAFVQAPSSLQHSFQGFLIFESQPIVIFGRPVLNTCQP